MSSFSDPPARSWSFGHISFTKTASSSSNQLARGSLSQPHAQNQSRQINSSRLREHLEDLHLGIKSVALLDNVSLSELASVCSRVRHVVTSVRTDQKRLLQQNLQRLLAQPVPRSPIGIAAAPPYPGAFHRRCNVCNDRSGRALAEMAVIPNRQISHVVRHSLGY